ncbi:MAG: Rrf2 family transcriptional regulator [Deltaproteobacteria bacterium]|nr:Rrf2 family transcriptional regulator [Deltaproteobacteria bacterium]
MKVTTICRYGIRAMIELARNYGNDPISVGVIAEKEEISRKYLDHIMSRLKTAGFVRVIRGVNGGFVLSHDPSQITLGDIFRVLEGDPAIVECVHTPDICNRSGKCAARGVWIDMTYVIEGFLESKTLKELIDYKRVYRKRAGTR